MAARPTWKGLLKIGLVQIPIKVFPATDSSETISFNQLHEPCQSRIHQKRWCETCAKEVPSAEIVKGFECEPGHYVLLSDAELEAAKPPSARVIDLTTFAEASKLDPTYIDRTYYLAPDGSRAAEAFAVMRDGMGGKVGVGKLAIYGREYLVAVRPRQRTLLLHTLHHAAEIRSPQLFEDQNAGVVIIAASQVRLARQVIAAFAGPLELGEFTDAHQASLRSIIDAKVKGKQIVVPVVDTPAVVPLREALEQSLRAESAKKQTPAKAKLLTRKRAS